MPFTHVSAVQALPSLQSEEELHGWQLEIAACWQPTNGMQGSWVQALPSSPEGGVPARQAWDPPRTSGPLQGAPSLQSAEPPSSVDPLQSLSTPSHFSLLVPWPIDAVADWSSALVACVVASSSNVGVEQVGCALLDSVTTTCLPTASAGTMTSRGLVEEIVQVAAGSSELTVTVAPVK